jgi:hypothetical protein
MKERPSGFWYENFELPEDSYPPRSRYVRSGYYSREPSRYRGPRRNPNSARNIGIAALLIAVGLGAIYDHSSTKTQSYANPVKSQAAASAVAGKAGLDKPLPCPSGAVHVSPDSTPGIQANTNYCFDGTYNNLTIAPQNNDGFFGLGDTVMNGDNSTAAAFQPNGAVSDVVINGFELQDYSTPVHYQSPGVINFHDGGSEITISDNTIGPDSASAIAFSGPGVCNSACSTQYSVGVNHSLITHNLIHDIGYSGTTISFGTDDTVSYNDVSKTDLFGSDTEDDVAAVGKFAVDEDTDVDGNYIHDNNDTAMWFDVNDTSSTIKENRVGPNNRVGIFYEISTNAVISDNYIFDNGQEDAGHALGAPGAGIRISSSGSADDSPQYGNSPPRPGPESIKISDNKLVGNHEGITLFDGHKNGDGSDIFVNSTNVSGNCTIGDATPSTENDSDAWLAHNSPSGHDNIWQGNIYVGLDSSEAFALNDGTTSYSGWQENGLDMASSDSSYREAAGASATC